MRPFQFGGGGSSCSSKQVNNFAPLWMSLVLDTIIRGSDLTFFRDSTGIGYDKWHISEQTHTRRL
jgi:hypothetical protein